MPKTSIIHIIDEDDAVRTATELVLTTSGFNTRAYASAEAFQREYRGQRNGCIILDMKLSGKSGLDLLLELREKECTLPALMTSAKADVAIAVMSMKLGAFDFLEKPVDPEVLLAKVGEALLQNKQLNARQTAAAAPREKLSTLTSREMEVLRRLIAGKPSKLIAAELGVADKTVSNHRAHLLAKTGAKNTAELVRIAVLCGVT